jgi:predicted metalloprotease with PDZ domain
MRRLRVLLFCTALCVVSIASAAPIRLFVDATDAPRRVLHAHMVIPAQPGPMTLWYPKWIPGEHGPTGPMTQVAGLKISAGGAPLPWSRDLLDMYAFHVEVPKGATELAVDLDFLDPVSSGQFTAGGSMTQQLAVISWNTVLLYPAAKSSEDLTYEATLRLPAGWQYATALTVASSGGGEIHFAPLTLTHLIDSPLLAGVHLRKIDIPSSSPFPHRIDIAADSDAATVTPDDFTAKYGRLVEEERAAFGAEHFNHYDWLLTLSDSVAHFGLEHHESSDDRTDENTLGDQATRYDLAALLAHEYSHSWNGKYRRPAGLAVPNYDVPMTGELLWVYEGLTEFLGYLMPARAGLYPTDYYRENVAMIASMLTNRPGRSWRPLADTAVDAQELYGAPDAWASYRRSTDFYEESLLLWLDVDMTIRKLTGDKRSLDDFLRRFYGGSSGDPVVKPYTFDDVVRALNEVAPNDWAAFLNSRLQSKASAPMGGLEWSGWKLAYDDQPNAALQTHEKRNKNIDATATIGIIIGEDGRVTDVVPGSPASKAALVPGARIFAVNGRHFTPDTFRTAIRESKASSAPMQVIYESQDFVNVTAIDYHGGARYPHLVRIEGTPDRLALMTAPRAKK